MNRIVVCLDCPNYLIGGVCNLTKKDVGALQPACEKSKELTQLIEDETMNTTTPQTAPVAPQTKHCSRCGQDLPLDAFGLNRSAPDGKQHWCKTCMNAATSRAKSNRPENASAKAKAKGDRPVKKIALKETQTIVVREQMTDEQMVKALRDRGWEVTCKRTVTEEL